MAAWERRGIGVIVWCRVLDLKSGGFLFKSSTLLLSGFVLRVQLLYRAIFVYLFILCRFTYLHYFIPQLQQQYFIHLPPPPPTLRVNPLKLLYYQTFFLKLGMINIHDTNIKKLICNKDGSPCLFTLQKALRITFI